MRFTVIAASALALLLTSATSATPAAPTPTKLWYKLKIVYLGSLTSESIRGDGGKTSLVMKVAFTGAPDSAVLVRSVPGGALTIRAGTFSGRLTRFEWDHKQDMFVGSHAPCLHRVRESLVRPATLDGTFGALPGSRRGSTHLGVSVATFAKTRLERFAVAPCANPIPLQKFELLNEAGVQKGELPLFLVKESIQADNETSPLAMLRIPSTYRKTPEGRTVGKFGQQSFSITARPIVTYGPKSIGSVIDSFRVDETWFFNFTRCPGTSPC